MGQTMLDDIGHVQERAPLLSEGQVHHLVGSIQNAGSIAALPDGFVGHVQATELLLVGLLEGKLLHLPPVQSWKRTGDSLRIRECQLDGNSHVGNSQLCFHCPVGELYGTVYDALRMHYYLYLLWGNIEQPLGLNDFEAFVHHTCRVDGNLGSHVPVGMFECHGRGHCGQLLLAEGAERTSAGSQDYLLHGTCLPHETLEDGAVLTIHRQDGRPFLET